MAKKKIKIPESGPKKVVFDCKKKIGCFILHVSEKLDVTVIPSSNGEKDEQLKNSGLNIIINVK